jgi:hypothetical protein
MYWEATVESRQVCIRVMGEGAELQVRGWDGEEGMRTIMKEAW